MMLEILKSDEINSPTFDYFNIQNIAFDHPLSENEIEEFKNLVFSPNNLHQIYFKGTIDTKSIEAVKNLLSISGFVDDRKVEKYIVANLDREDINELLDSTYENPTTWQISYDKDGRGYILSDIPRCRTFYSYIDRIKNSLEIEELSDFEKVLKVYNIVKLFEYVDDVKGKYLDLLTSIVVSNKASSLGFNKLFSYILRELGFKSFVGKVKSKDGDISFVTIADIKDCKYEIDGVYLFDPSMDTLPKSTYKNENIRMINYNYFGLILDDISYSSYDDMLIGILGIISINDFEYSKDKLESSNSLELSRELTSLEAAFSMSFNELHSRINSSNPIPFDVTFDAIQNIYKGSCDVPNYDELLKENYKTRKKELFFPKTEEILKKLLD